MAENHLSLFMPYNKKKKTFAGKDRHIFNFFFLIIFSKSQLLMHKWCQILKTFAGRLHRIFQENYNIRINIRRASHS